MWPGILLLSLSLVSAMAFRDLSFGSISDIGPGMIPLSLTFLLAMVSIVTIFKGTQDTLEQSIWSWTPLLIVSLVMLFAWMITIVNLYVMIFIVSCFMAMLWQQKNPLKIFLLATSLTVLIFLLQFLSR